MGPPPPPPSQLAALSPPPETPDAALPQQTPSGGGGFSLPRPTVRVTSEYDSDSQVFFHRVSCRLVDSLAKLRISFMNNRDGEISCPMLRLDLGKRLSVDYDVEAKNALVRGSFDVGKNVNLQAYSDLKVRWLFPVMFQLEHLVIIEPLTTLVFRQRNNTISLIGLPRTLLNWFIPGSFCPLRSSTVLLHS